MYNVGEPKFSIGMLGVKIVVGNFYLHNVSERDIVVSHSAMSASETLQGHSRKVSQKEFERNGQCVLMPNLRSQNRHEHQNSNDNPPDHKPIPRWVQDESFQFQTHTKFQSAKQSLPEGYHLQRLTRGIN